MKNIRRGDNVPKGFRAGEVQQFDKQQTGLYNQRSNDIGPSSYLNRLASGDESAYSEMENPAYQQFQDQINGLGSRFGGFDQGGGRNVSQGANDFGMRIRSQRMNMRNQALHSLFSYSQSLLGQRSKDRFLYEKQPKKGNNLTGYIGAGAGAIGGGYLGGPEGAIQGANAGYKVGSAFNG